MLLLLTNPAKASDYEIPSTEPDGWYFISHYHGRQINCDPLPNGTVNFTGIDWNLLSDDLSFKPIFVKKIINKREPWEIENNFPPSEYYRFQIDKKGNFADMYPGSGLIEGKGFHFSFSSQAHCSPPYVFWVQGDSWSLLKKACDSDFIGCITGKFSKKFPFDIFSLPSTEITCPKVNFFGEDFDLCFIYEALRLFKYPIAAALIIKLFLYL
jgi:hypothetical protein